MAGTVEGSSGTPNNGPALMSPPLSDLAAVVIFHEWSQDLRDNDEDTWFMIGGAKGMVLDSISSPIGVDSVFPLYGMYRGAYGSCAPPQRFIIACLYLYYTNIDTAQPGQSSTSSILQTKQYNQIHPFLWDDYIRCFTIAFPRYVSECQIGGRVPMSVIQFYNTRVPTPKNVRQVLSAQSLGAFVLSAAVRPICALFTKKIVELQATVMAERAREHNLLRAAVAERKTVEQELEMLKAKEHDLMVRRIRAERREAISTAIGTGAECNLLDFDSS